MTASIFRSKTDSRYLIWLIENPRRKVPIYASLFYGANSSYHTLMVSLSVCVCVCAIQCFVINDINFLCSYFTFCVSFARSGSKTSDFIEVEEKSFKRFSVQHIRFEGILFIDRESMKYILIWKRIHETKYTQKTLAVGYKWQSFF